MAVVLRGWSRTASTAVKLATAESILGYQFNDVDRLYEALDQTKWGRLPSGGLRKQKRRNSRLAVVGDAHANLYLAQKWYDHPTLTGSEWTRIHMSTLSNESFAEVGFKLGLDECALHDRIRDRIDMATTIEAILAAVEMDGAGPEQFHRVMVRFGLRHKLIEPIQSAWIYQAVQSTLELPDRFFIGHHFKLQEGVFATQLQRFTIQEHETGLRRSLDRLLQPANRLWKRAERLWSGHQRVTRSKYASLQGKQPRVSTSTTQEPSKGSKPSTAEGPRSTATETPITYSNEVAATETEVPDEDSSGRLKAERSIASDQTTERQAPAKKQESVETLNTEVPTPSKRTGKQPRSSPSNDTTADDVVTAEAGLQNPSKASMDEPAPNQSTKAGAVVGLEQEVKHQPQKASQDDQVPGSSSQDGAAAGAERDVEHEPDEASEAEPVEATGNETLAELKQGIARVTKRDKQLYLRQVEFEKEFCQLRQAKEKKTKDQVKLFNDVVEARMRLKQRRASMVKKLKETVASKA